MAKPRWLTRLARSLGYVSKAEAVYQTVVQRMDTSVERYGTADLRGGLTTFAQLRSFARACDAVGNAIQLRIDQTRTLPLEIVPMPDFDEDEVTAELDAAHAYLATDGGFGGPGLSQDEFLTAAIRDLLEVGCLAVYARPNKGGEVFSHELVDAATIKPLQTLEGWPVQGDDIGFEQYNASSGRKVADIPANRMRYVRYASCTYSRWGRSPTENVLMAILEYIGYDVWNLAFLSDGDGDFSYWTTPSDWSADQRRAFDAVLAALNRATAGRKTMAEVSFPAGVKRESARPRKEGDFEETQVHLVRRIARAFGFTATALGFEGAQFKVSQEASIERADTEAGDVTKLLLSRLLTDILQHDLGLTRIKAQWPESDKDLEPIARVLQTAGTQYIPVNEGRELLGQPPLEGPYVDVAFLPSQFGPIILGWRPGTTPPVEIAVTPATTPTPPALPAPPPEGLPPAAAPVAAKALPSGVEADLAKWQRVALKRLREGHVAKAAAFVSETIPPDLARTIGERLAVAKSETDVRAAFDSDERQVVESVAAKVLAAVREEQARRVH